MKFFIVVALLAAAAAAPSSPAYPASYPADYKTNYATITAQSDVRNPDGSGSWSYGTSDYTTREHAYAQKQLSGYSKDTYGKDYEYGAGHTDRGSSYWVSPDSQKLTLTWVADENGFQPKGEHLPVAPALPYQRTGLGF